ncbi:bola-like protein [Auriscalpium vulgare]|uniref:Bola-like protein n=1 Tax=Auriscalpium vulgare TaxID=40419 RepID=A0ACB8S9E1_9AGAM|nr:bola-like protein [Auriscalpium vulgare]
MFSTLARRAVAPTVSHARSYTAAARTPLVPPSQLDDGERSIFTKLADRFQPSELLVQDVSGGCGSFYAITISSEAFKGIPIVKQHRLVNDVLKKDIESIHGLQLKTIPL